MRLVQYTVPGENRLGVVMADRIVDVRKTADSAGQDTKAFTSTLALLVTADEVPHTLNGETMQDSNTNQLIFNIPKVVSYFSHSFTLDAGDLIATGTAAGVGFSRKSPVYLNDGDVVEVEIERIGRISNRAQRGY